MPCVVVLGMHRAGTSLVASMLEALGVHMGDELMGPSTDQPNGHWEDLEFVKLNEYLLRMVGGSWRQPPPEQAVWLAGQAAQRDVKLTVLPKQRERPLWGWKDPRTALTAPVYHRWLEDACYVWVQRDRDAVVSSLLAREGGAPSAWMALYDEYERRIEAFLGWCGAPALNVRYEDLVDEGHVEQEVYSLADFVGVDDKKRIRHALARVELRATHPGFGKVAVGVPYFKASYKFWRWWSWLINGGFENGDIFLNDWDVPGEVPIPTAHNALVRAFLDTSCDTLCMIEDDHCGDPDVVRSMRFKRENWAYDVVCASYTNRRGVPRAIGGDFIDETARGYRLHRDMRDVALEGTQPYDVAALGLVFIRREVIEAILGDQNPAECFWFEWNRANSQDIAFYRQVKELGFRVGVDRDHWIGHLGEKEWTKDDFLAWLEMAKQVEAELSDGGTEKDA